MVVDVQRELVPEEAAKELEGIGDMKARVFGCFRYPVLRVAT